VTVQAVGPVRCRPCPAGAGSRPAGAPPICTSQRSPGVLRPAPRSLPESGRTRAHRAGCAIARAALHKRAAHCTPPTGLQPQDLSRRKPPLTMRDSRPTETDRQGHEGRLAEVGPGAHSARPLSPRPCRMTLTLAANTKPLGRRTFAPARKNVASSRRSNARVEAASRMALRRRGPQPNRKRSKRRACAFSRSSTRCPRVLVHGRPRVRS